MRLGMLWRDLWAGLRRRPSTVPYPRARVAPPPQLRGALQWDPARCTGCALCVKDCPAGAIELITLDKAARRFQMRYAADRCVFCSQCVQSCRFNCLELSPAEWELAACQRQSLIRLMGTEDHDTAVVGR